MIQFSTASNPSLGVFVGRFQPYHAGHHHVVVSALEKVDHLLVLVGSANMPRGMVNTFTAQERIEMIRACLSPEQSARVSLVGLEDSRDSSQEWVESVQRIAEQTWEHLYGSSKPNIALVGHNKDHSSYYLRLFPFWDSIDVPAFPSLSGEVLSATPLREHLLGSRSLWLGYLEQSPDVGKSEFINLAVGRARPAALSWLDSQPDGVMPATIPLLRQFVLSDRYEDPCRESAYASHFRFAWRHSPYTPIFVTADPVVFHGDHVLMVRRADYPGRGQWALPGGFVEADEPIFQACLRELAEETALGMTAEELSSRMFFHKHYDNPRRSVRGRVITHAYGFALDPNRPRPQASFNNESMGLSWININDLRRDESFEDHFNIVHRFHRQMPRST